MAELQDIFNISFDDYCRSSFVSTDDRKAAQDETPIQVLNPEEHASSKNNFMVVQAGTSGDWRTILFTYVSNRRIKTIDSLLVGHKQYVQTTD